MINSETESATIERFADKWIARGHRLVANPRGSDVPDFLRSYRPDAVLLGNPNIIVEVLRKGDTDTLRKVDAIRSLISDHPDWTLEVIYSGVPEPEFEAPATERIRQSLSDLFERRGVLTGGEFLMLWAVLEATARALRPNLTQRAQSPGRVVEILAGEGLVSADDADHLRAAANYRSRLIHGDLDATPPDALVRQMIKVVEGLADMLDSQRTMRN